MPSISMEDLEWAMQSTEQGTRPSRAGERSVVLTRHQSGLSWQRSRTSTVWPRRTVSSLLLLAMKSCMTTVSSQPPESLGRKGNHSGKQAVLTVFFKWILRAVCVSWRLAHLVAVQCVLWSAGCQRDGVRLAAAFTLTVQVLSIPNENTQDQ